MKKKVGLILDDGKQSKQIFDLVRLSTSAENYEISHIIVQTTSKTNAKSLKSVFRKFSYLIKKHSITTLISKITYRFLLSFEKIIVKKIPRYSSFFDLFDLNEISGSKIYVSPIISRSGFVYRYSSKDLNKIKLLNLDMLIRGGSGIYKGGILSVCPHGVISFHHADNDVNRGGPPGFWEVFEKQKSTGFIIQILKEELDGGDVLFKGSIATSFMYTLNLARLYTKSNLFMHRVLDDIFSDNRISYVYPKKPYDCKLYRIPNIWVQFKYIVRTVYHAVKKIFRKFMGRSMRWGIAYQFSENWREVTLWKSNVVENLPNRFFADPFIIKRNGKHYCFVEDYDYKSSCGVISVFEITRTGHVNLGVALEEDFHLSYPFIFEADGEIFMCPETAEVREIRIYRCKSFPLEWEYEKTLINDVSAADTNVFFHGGKWWIMTNIDSSNIDDHGSELHIFSSETLLHDTWEPHPLNPVIFDSQKARNGGLLFEDGDIFRVFQIQGWDMYGQGFGVSKIKKLDSSEYEEEVEFRVSSKFFKSALGTHTYSYDNGLMVTDFCRIQKYKN